LIAIIGLEEISKANADTSVPNQKKRKLETVKSEARLPTELIGYTTNEEEEAVYEVTSSSDEFYTDRSHRIGNFNESLDLLLTTKDTLKLQKRFKLLVQNWRHSQIREQIAAASKEEPLSLDFIP
jgi:hypothetical protein